MMAERLKISKADSNNFSAGPRREELHGHEETSSCQRQYAVEWKHQYLHGMFRQLFNLNSAFSQDSIRRYQQSFL